MALPNQPVILDVEQVDDLNKQLAEMRHDINNTLSLIVAAVELMRVKPQMSERMLATLMEQPAKITASMGEFTTSFERVVGITRP
jgi:hypothetical protein